MKQFSFSLILILFATILTAQEQLKVEYEMIPYYNPVKKESAQITMLNSYYELFVSGSESSYQYLDKIRNDQPKEGNGFTATIQMGSRGTIYKNTTENLLIEETSIYGKDYLIASELPEFKWNISKESKNILGFEVRKATTVLDDKHKTKITAWYAPKLNVKTGPDEYWGLPGLILEVESGFDYEDGGNEGFTFKALKVEVMKESIDIQKPTKGIKVSKEELNEIMKKQNEKMMEMYEGGVDKD